MRTFNVPPTELATEAAKPPVRLVKTIGDEAMLVSPEPAAVVSVALELVDGASERELPSFRAAIAAGFALARVGDYDGHPVNLASRVTGIAHPGSVLCRQDARDEARDLFDWSFAGRHRFKGIAQAIPLTPRATAAAKPTSGPRPSLRPASGRQPARVAPEAGWRPPGRQSHPYWTFNRSTTNTSVELAGIVGGLPFAP